jgi:vancomycin resistance protein YoaR
MLTLPPELKGALNMATGVDVAALQQQVAALTQQAQQQAQQIDEYRRTIDADMVSSQNQLVMARMNNEAALRSKLVEIQARAAENEKDRQLEMAKLTVDQRSDAEALYIKSREADAKAAQEAREALAEAERLRIESEKARADIVAKLAATTENTLTHKVTEPEMAV